MKPCAAGVSHEVIAKAPENGIMMYVVTGMIFSKTSESSDRGAKIKQTENVSRQ
jgi:hypothetical protein